MEHAELTSEQREKMKASHTEEELFALAKTEGIELTDRQLDAIAGGQEGWASTLVCPYCGGTFTVEIQNQGVHESYHCFDCDKDF